MTTFLVLFFGQFFSRFIEIYGAFPYVLGPNPPSVLKPGAPAGLYKNLYVFGENLNNLPIFRRLHLPPTKKKLYYNFT